ncbi:accessory gland protein Acp36DE [Drosophila tropicalis]|uniref:accessory gland protein Acp36DE n=1 Tax=Drosophila tropicalis TaxID=46794 RepID=UPI0035ABA033
MTPKRKRHSRSEAAAKSKAKLKEEHLQLLEELDLADSCCDICHCDCYSSHSSSNVSARNGPTKDSEELRQLDQDIKVLEQLHQKEKECKRSHSRTAKSPSGIEVKVTSRSRRGSATEIPSRGSTASRSRRSKSAGSQRSIKEEVAKTENEPLKSRQRGGQRAGRQKDCKMLQSILGSLNDTPALSIVGKGKSKSQDNVNHVKAPSPKSNLCVSMANLCLAPTVRAAYQQIPTHDQKILNRMAVKRSQQAADKEHAWLARKYWENERLERQLLKCEQVEEYKRAVHDKQFQDYLMTKARLQALAERDLAELRRLRGALDAKDAAAKQRLASMKLERDLTLCQRRCEELRRSEAVTVQQEEQNLDATLKKRDICMRLTQRLRRADELRTELLESYLRRLQHDNYVEQAQHEEHWRERQQIERLKREQLKEDIQRKRRQSQRFVEGRQRHHEARYRTAKISASLRELVRQSVTPEGGNSNSPAVGLDQEALSYYAQQQVHLGRLLFDQPHK